jgi:hypothetical protein
VTQPTRDELLQRLAGAQAETEAVTMALIYLELDELLTGLSATEDQAAAGLRQAVEALEVPLARLAAMDQEITRAEGRCVEWSERLSDADPDKRAEARNHYDEWSAEVGTLRAARDECERGFRPLFEDRERCRDELRIMQGGKRVLVAAMLDPFGPLGQQTKAYETYRMPQIVVPVLLARDLESREWDKAAAEFDELAMRSGLRTDHLPSEAEQVARALAEPLADASQYVEPVPSGQDVIAADKAQFANSALQNSPSRIDDYRNTPAVPRNLPERDWMKLPGRGAR